MKGTLTTEIIAKKFPAFTEPDLLEALMENGKFHTCSENEILFSPGMEITHVPLVLFGRIRLFRQDPGGKEVFLYSIRPGESCAVALGCCNRAIHGEIKADAEEDTEMILLPVKVMDEWVVRFREWRTFVMTTFHSRFSELLHVVDMIAFGQLDERLIYFLKETASNKHTRRIRITHQEIAESLGSSREVITRLLRQMEKDGKVKTGRNQLELMPTLFEEMV